MHVIACVYTHMHTHACKYIVFDSDLILVMMHLQFIIYIHI